MPIWKNADLISTIESPRKADITDAERFAEATATKLGLGADYVLPAFEDPGHWLQKEAALLDEKLSRCCGLPVHVVGGRTTNATLMAAG